MSDDTPAQLLEVRTLHRGFSSFLITLIRLPGGGAVTREIEDHGEVVAVLPYDPDRRTVLLVRQFRPAPFYKGGAGDLIEAPAGLIDEAEAPEAAARREAQEETGAVLGALEPVGSVWTSPGVSTERMTLYLAACAFAGRSAGGGKPGEQEDITVLETPLADLAAWLDRGEIEDLKLLALALALRLRRPDLF